MDGYKPFTDRENALGVRISELTEHIADLTRQREAEERLHRLQTGDLNFQLAEARAALDRQNAAMREAIEALNGHDDCLCNEVKDILAALNPTA